MRDFSPDTRGRVAAILGPTNTGKTHYAIERMLAHRTGVIGLPLRLLAREVYDKIVALRGPSVVALVTGEERIVPERTPAQRNDLVIDLPSQQAQRQADDARPMRQHPFDCVMGLSGVRGAQNGDRAPRIGDHQMCSSARSPRTYATCGQFHKPRVTIRIQIPSPSTDRISSSILVSSPSRLG